MKTELAICFVVAAGIHAGLALVGPSTPRTAQANSAIEVGLEDGLVDANATDRETIPAQADESVPADTAPAPPESPATTTKPESVPEAKTVEAPPDSDLEQHEMTDKPATASPPATTTRPVISAVPATPPPRPAAASGVNANQSSPARARAGGGGASGIISTVRYRQRAALSYPMSALRARAEGTVLLVVGIDGSGRPTDVTVRRSSGRHDLDAAAIACARQSTYEAYRVNGIPQPCRVEAPFQFDAGSRRQ